MSTLSVPLSDKEQVDEQVLDNSQQQPNPVRPTLTVVRVDGLPRLKTLFRGKERKYYITATDGLRTEKTSAVRSREQSVQWDEMLSSLTVKPSSRLIMHVFAQRTWLRDVHIGLLAIPFELIRRSPLREFDISSDPMRKTTLILSVSLPEVSQRATTRAVVSPEAPGALESAALGPAEPNASSDVSNSADPMHIAEKGLSEAGEAISNLGRAQSLPLDSLLNATEEAPDQLESVTDLYNTWKVALGNVKSVVDVVDKIAEIHPWAKMAWSVLSCIPKTYIAQVERDNSFKALLVAIRDAFDLAKLAKALESLQPESVQAGILKDMLCHVGSCGDLIQNYAKETNFWKRLVQNIGGDASGKVRRYSETLIELRDAFLRQGAIATQMTVIALSSQLEEVASSITDVGLDVKLPFPEGARHSKDKTCIPGTRVAFLDYITNWVNNPESPRTLVLFGQAGTGKSSIANELACRFEKTHRLASSFVFSRTRKTDQSHRAAHLLFSGIARNLADRYPTFKASLAKILSKDASLASGTRDHTTPFESLLLRPLQESPLIGPIFIVIDALDESGDASGRNGLHTFLASHISKLPDTFRILITSRPEKDIEDAFDPPESPSVAEILYMDDSKLSTQTSEDIHVFVRHQLRKKPDLLRQCGAELARKAGNSFQWAAVACDYVQFGPAGLTPRERADQLLQLPSERSESVNFLDSLYKTVLSAYFGNGKAPPSKFTSVMGQIIAAFEPLSTCSLATLRSYNDPSDLIGDGSVHSIVGYLGSLLSNVSSSKSSLPIVPLHASFRDFLTDPKRADEFWINLGDAHYQLTRSSFGLMRDKLRLNICELSSSDTRNEDIEDLQSRIREHFSDALSYTCRSWDGHLEHVSPDKILDGVQSFFENDFLHWLEAMSLLGVINLVPRALSILETWLAKHRDSRHLLVLDTLTTWVTDALKFVGYFGRPIAQSAPHIYLSALPFCPEASIIFDHYAKRFPNTLSLQRGRMPCWPIQEMVIPLDSMCLAIAFSPDGSRLVSGSYTCTLHVWSAKTGHTVAGPFTGHTEPVRSVMFSPDGYHIVSSSDDRTIRVWDAKTGHPVTEPFTGHADSVWSVAFSPDGCHIASGSDDQTVRVWDAKTGRALAGPFIGHTDPVKSVMFSPDGHHIASGSADCTIRVWGAETGLAVAGPFTGHTYSVNSIAFSPDGCNIASGSDDQTIRVWDAKTGNAVAGPFTGHTDGVGSVAFSPDGHRIVSGSDDHTIRVWDVKTGNAAAGPFTGHIDSVVSVTFSPDGHHIASGSDDYTIRVWSAEMEHTSAGLFTGHTEWVTSVAFSPDGHHIASGSYDCTIRVWDFKTGHAAAGPFTGHTNWITSVAFSPDGNHIASGSNDYTVRVWNFKMGYAAAGPFMGHTGSVNSVAFSPDGHHIASGSDDYTVRVWDSRMGHASARPFTGHTGSVTSVAFSPDGRHIASGSHDNTVRVWDAETGHAVVGPFKGHTISVWSVAFSPDGHHIASGSDDSTIRVWDAKTGRAVAGPFMGHTSPVTSVAFSPDSRHIASSSHDYTIGVWDAETGHTVAGPFAGHTRLITSVVFSPDGHHIASGSFDGTIRVWDAEVGHTATGPFRTGHSKSVASVAFSPDGHRIASSSPVPSIAVQGPPSFMGQSVMDDEGWICGEDGELLMWIPEPHRLGLHRPGTVWVTAERETVLDLSRFVHGRNWMQCGGQMGGTTQ